MYHHTEEKRTVKDSAKLAIKATLNFREKARIPTQRIDSAERKLLKLYDEYYLLKKARLRVSENQKLKESMFLDELQSLFDASSKDALEIMRNEEEKTSSCSMTSVDKNLVDMEKRKQVRIEKEETRKGKHCDSEIKESEKEIENLSDASDIDESELDNLYIYPKKYQMCPKNQEGVSSQL